MKVTERPFKERNLRLRAEFVRFLFTQARTACLLLMWIIFLRFDLSHGGLLPRMMA